MNWSKAGVWIGILGIVFGAFITYYFSVLYQKNPNLKIIIHSNTKILDIKEDLPKLDIIYDNVSIKRQLKNISVITFRLINDGSESILTSYYDDNYPFGIKINNGTILSTPELLSSSDTTYYKAVVDTIIDNHIYFTKVIYDEMSFVDFKCLVMHDILETPSLEPYGKIAKIKDIKVIREYLKDNRSVMGPIINTNRAVESFRWLFILIPISILILIASSLRIKIVHEMDEKTTEKPNEYNNDF